MGKKKKIRQEIRAFRPFSVEKHGDMGYNGIRNDFGREERKPMIQIPFIPTELCFALLWLLLRVLVWVRQRKIDWKREAVLLLIAVNYAVILRFVFFPMSPVEGKVQPLLFDPARIWPFRLNLIPVEALRHYKYRSEMLVNVIGNVAMFLPTGIVYPLVYPRLDRFWKVLCAGAGLSLFIELAQLPFYVRSTDVDDLILNTTGVILGYGIYALVKKGRRFRERKG